MTWFYVWKRTGIEVFLYYVCNSTTRARGARGVQTKLMLADPVPRLYELHSGDRSAAHHEANALFRDVKSKQCLHLYGRLGGFRLPREDAVGAEEESHTTHRLRWV